jgi:hypothetical protein
MTVATKDPEAKSPPGKPPVSPSPLASPAIGRSRGLDATLQLACYGLVCLAMACAVGLPWYATVIAPDRDLDARIERAHACSVKAHLTDPMTDRPVLRVSIAYGSGERPREALALPALGSRPPPVRASAFWDGFPVGASVACYYDRARPSAVAVAPGVPGLVRSVSAWAAVVAFLTAFGIGSLIAAGRRALGDALRRAPSSTPPVWSTSHVAPQPQDRTPPPSRWPRATLTALPFAREAPPPRDRRPLLEDGTVAIDVHAP